MSKTIEIAPLKKVLTVNAPQQKAFDVFTAGINRWWPKGHGLGAAPLVRSTIEPKLGGRWFTEHENGEECTVGHMTVWEPPYRVIFSWEISAQWKPSTTVASEVEVLFIAEGPNTTRVELEHRNFEAMGAEDGAKMRSDVNGGWPGILELFKAEAER